MMPSTPQSSNRRISCGSSTVHTCTATPALCARCTNRGETTRVPPLISGTWNAWYGTRPGESPHQDRYSANRTSNRAPLVAMSGAAARAARNAVTLNDPRHTLPIAPARRTSSTTAVASAAPRSFNSMMMRVCGKRASTSRNVGTSNSASSAAVRSLSGPFARVVRSSIAS